MQPSTERTLEQYNARLSVCRELFLNKTKDYGTAWRILRPASLTDQLFIKARRIRTLQETGVQRVQEGIEPEFVGLVNYSLMALIQLEMRDDERLELPLEEVLERYDRQADSTRRLMLDKNHDYGEVWRLMRLGSFTDLILMKLLRIKQIEDRGGTTLVSEGVDAGYRDIVNYAVFALIHLHYQTV